jgi:predicted nucleotidyltransferase component of viral defense system
MEQPKENRDYYASTTQREVFLKLLTHPTIEGSFFLTGGTALAVFYLFHRVSDDLDLFSLNPVNFAEIDFWIRSTWQDKCSKIKGSTNFLSFLIQETKVDLVIDPLSNREKRERVKFENEQSVLVDNIINIASNKFSCIVSRTEPKDYVDLFYLFKLYPDLELATVYQNAKLKDAIFDDPPTAGFQLEEGISFLKENPSLMPGIKREFNLDEFSQFFEEVLEWLYGRYKA